MYVFSAVRSNKKSILCHVYFILNNDFFIFFVNSNNTDVEILFKLQKEMAL